MYSYNADKVNELFWMVGLFFDYWILYILLYNKKYS